jgi:hypothetical protein
MVRPCVARVFADLSVSRSCINVSGLSLERVLRATMDINAPAFSLVSHRAFPKLQRRKSWYFVTACLRLFRGTARRGRQGWPSRLAHRHSRQQIDDAHQKATGRVLFTLVMSASPSLWLPGHWRHYVGARHRVLRSSANRGFRCLIRPPSMPRILASRGTE